MWFFTLGHNFQKQQTNLKYNSVWNNCVYISNELIPANNKKKVFLHLNNPIFLPFLCCYILGSSKNTVHTCFIPQHGAGLSLAALRSSIHYALACLYLLMHLAWGPRSYLYKQAQSLLLYHSASPWSLAMSYTSQRALQGQWPSFTNRQISREEITTWVPAARICSLPTNINEFF